MKRQQAMVRLVTMGSYRMYWYNKPGHLFTFIENELDWLARHLGHNITVHREYYRLHESTIELAKVGKILTTVDEGKTQHWAGKSLDDIDLDKDIDLVTGRYKPFPWQVLGGNAWSFRVAFATACVKWEKWKCQPFGYQVDKSTKLQKLQETILKYLEKITSLQQSTSC